MTDQPDHEPAIAKLMVVFDLGGVVVKICRSWPEACAAAGLPYRHVDTTPEGVARRRALVRLYETNQLTCDQYFDRLAATMEGHYTPAEVKALHDAWITDQYPGIETLIHDLHALAIPTGVLSNTNAHHWRQMSHALGRPARFPAPTLPKHRHASHLLGLAKPDQEIYHRFAQIVCPLEGLRAEHLVFFDDLPDNVAAARAAGWQAHHIDHTADPPAQIRQHLSAILPSLARRGP
jgi:HAD superfamily hydrolase (TIGR01509 family)